MPCHGDTYSTVGREKFSLGPLWGGNSLFEMPGEEIFWGETENFRFCLGGGLTLDDTMGYI